MCGLRGLVLGVCVLLGARTAMAGSELDGMWVGAYDYGDQLGDTPIFFSVVIETQGDEVRGRSLEVQTFGNEPAIGLGATLKGHSSGNVVSLVKQYDGSGGQTHAVHLRLHYDPSQGLIGEWMLNPQTKGRVELAKMQFLPAADDSLLDDGWDE